jgi:carbon monoxide dehydrogenase subunit G
VIETSHRFVVDAEIDHVWAYVSQIDNWASSMPGYQAFEAVDELHSKWVLKVALGALTRTVPLEVTITDRRKPDHISFTLRGESDPVDGQGTFTASATGARQTSVVVTLAISGNGPMAATMEAMSRPVVPHMTRVLSEALKTAIESSAVAPISPRSSQPAATNSRTRRKFGKIHRPAVAIIAGVVLTLGLAVRWQLHCRRRRRDGGL